MSVKWYLQHWRGVITVLTPLVLLPIPLLSPTAAARCGYVILIMAVYWVSESVHLAATALIPIFAFPFLGVLSTKDVCMAYLKDTNMLFLGGLAMAAAIEHSGLHERIALFILCHVGSSTGGLLLGFMLTQMFLSMWISNTAATAMMVPIVDAVLSEILMIDKSYSEESYKQNSLPVLSPGSEATQEPDTSDAKYIVTEENAVTPNSKEKEPIVDATDRKGQSNNLRDVLYLGIAYASNIGGTGSLTGTNPNLVLIGFLNLYYPNRDTGVNYATWLMYNVPGMILCTVLGYIWLRIVLLYLSGWKSTSNQRRDEAVQLLLDNRYKRLGGLSFQEGVISSLFGVAVLLWIFRKPEVIQGWGPWIEQYTGTSISAASPAMFIVFLMFVSPSRPFWKLEQRNKGRSQGCLIWDVFHHKIPWGVIILIGGGFAMAEAGKVSGLSGWLGSQFGILAGLPKESILIIVCILTALITEIISNTAASSLLIPVLNDMSLSLSINPIYFILPVAICSSYAFMLPVATPPNAIVFESAKTMPVSRMMAAGFMMNIVCVAVAFLMANTLGNVVFDLQTFPEWANATIAS